MIRCVQPEWLDVLSPDAPSAIASRRDLQQLNWWMNHAAILRRALSNHGPQPPRQIVELGAGDGTFLLRLACQWPARNAAVHAVLVDRQNVVSADTRQAFNNLGWEVQVVQADALEWLEKPGPVADCLLANLFLHHFEAEALRHLLSVAATRTNQFAACEPRRGPLPLAVSRILGIIGCNAVTRHDAPLSVRAGWAGRELSALWPADGQWQLSERRAGLFSHRFVARRK